MVFFKDIGDKPKTVRLKVTSFDKELSQELIKIVREKRKLNRTSTLTNWEIEFARLRKEVGKTRTTTTLKWYITHFGGDRTPQAYSASGFRKKFLAIEKAMEIDQEKNPTVDKISKEAQFVLDRLYMKIWTKGSRERLPTIVELSIRNYTNFTKSLFKLKFFQMKDKLFSKKGLLSPIISYVCSRLSPPVWFVENWFLRIHERVRDWDKWSGELRPFKPTHKDFKRTVQGWIDEYGCNQRLADKAFQLILEIM